VECFLHTPELALEKPVQAFLLGARERYYLEQGEAGLPRRALEDLECATGARWQRSATEMPPRETLY
jgi:hypothetical protein